MENFLTEFDNHSEYANYADTTMLRPNVSWCALEDEVHYTPVGLRMYYDTNTIDLGGIGEEAKKGANDSFDQYVLYIPEGEINKFETNTGGSSAAIEPVGIMVPGRHSLPVGFEKATLASYPEFLVGSWVATILASGSINPAKDNIYVVLQRILPRGAKSEDGKFPVKAVVKYRKIIDIDTQVLQ